jgi:hypothetical protein
MTPSGGLRRAGRRRLAAAERRSVPRRGFRSAHPFGGLTFVHQRGPHGVFAVHGYPIGNGVSTFIVETDEPSWTAAGLDEFDATQPPGPSDEKSRGYLEQLFARQIDGHPLRPAVRRPGLVARPGARHRDLERRGHPARGARGDRRRAPADLPVRARPRRRPGHRAHRRAGPAPRRPDRRAAAELLAVHGPAARLPAGLPRPGHGAARTPAARADPPRRAQPGRRHRGARPGA